MAKTGEIPPRMQEQIIQLHKEGQSTRKIGTRLSLRHTTVQYIIKKYKQSERIANAARKGRPRKTSQRTDRYISLLVQRGRESSASSLTTKMEEATGSHVCAQAIRNRLHEVR